MKLGDFTTVEELSSASGTRSGNHCLLFSRTMCHLRKRNRNYRANRLGLRLDEEVSEGVYVGN